MYVHFIMCTYSQIDTNMIRGSGIPYNLHVPLAAPVLCRPCIKSFKKVNVTIHHTYFQCNVHV